MKRLNDAFGSKCLWIKGYYWYGFYHIGVYSVKLNWSFLIAFLLCESQLQLYGNIACYPDVDPAYEAFYMGQSKTE